MERLLIHPSRKFIRAGYTVVFLILFVAVLAYNNVEWLQGQSPWLLAIPALLLIFPVNSHIRRNHTKLLLEEDCLRLETGILGKKTRVLRVAAIKDVRIDQTLSQRLWRVGTIRVETTRGENDLMMANIDYPEEVTRAILQAASRQSRKGDGP